MCSKTRCDYISFIYILVFSTFMFSMNVHVRKEAEKKGGGGNENEYSVILHLST